MDQSLTGDRKFRNEVVRIAELTVNTTVIEGYEFSNCRVIGPAVLGLLEDVTIVHSSWDAPGLDAVFWEIPDNRGPVVGAVGVRHCVFSNCSFEGVGIAGPPSFREVLASGFIER